MGMRLSLSILGGSILINEDMAAGDLRLAIGKGNLHHSVIEKRDFDSFFRAGRILTLVEHLKGFVSGGLVFNGFS